MSRIRIVSGRCAALLPQGSSAGKGSIAIQVWLFELHSRGAGRLAALRTDIHKVVRHHSVGTPMKADMKGKRAGLREGLPGHRPTAHLSKPAVKTGARSSCCSSSTARF